MSDCGCCFGLDQATGYCDACRGFSAALTGLLEKHQAEVLALEAEHSSHHRSRFGEPSVRDWTLEELLAPCDCLDCPECRARLDEQAPAPRVAWVLAKHPELGFVASSRAWTRVFAARRDIMEAWFPQISDLALDEVLR